MIAIWKLKWARHGLFMVALLFVMMGVTHFSGETAVIAGEADTIVYIPFIQAPFTSLTLEPFANGFDAPTDIKHAGDDRLFVAEHDGRILIVEANGTIVGTPFLDIRERVLANFEQGFLGIAFHPNFADNGYVYVHYTNLEGNTTIARFQRSDEDDNVADPDSEQILLTITQPSLYHQAGDLQFGPDGYLYVAIGDGGPPGDPNNNAQTRTNLLGTILRLDVNNGSPYAIPPDNPYVNNPGRMDEIWAFGLRNPWRISFDRQTGELYIADVGEGVAEEVNLQPANSEGGENYGWRCYEGTHPFNTNDCGPFESYTSPIYEYTREGSPNCISIVGGYVYRGQAYPVMTGYYFFADFCRRGLWGLRQNEEGVWEATQFGEFPNVGWSSFGEDVNGELYATGFSHATLYRVVPGN